MILEKIPDALMPWLIAYGEKREERIGIELPLDDLPPFTQTVLNVLLTIPMGQIKTYRDVAVLAGSPKAYRAAGAACGRNPFPLLIPCHRVIGSKGLTGFAYGLEVKKKLLEFESGTPLASFLENGRQNHERDRDTQKDRRA
jgi:O-6-methylguanine DNA methyltransferase